MGYAAKNLRRLLADTPVVLGVILCLAALLRFYDLDRTSLWYDEAISWYQASLAFGEMIAATAQDNYPPLHNLLLHVTIRFFGDSETALRAPSALLSLLDVYFVYRIGWVLWNRKTGLLAALFLALAGFHIWYATEARNYALLSAAASAYVWTALELARRPAFWRYAFNLTAGVTLLYSHVFGSVIFFAVGIFTILVLRSTAIGLNLPWRRWLALQCAAGLLFVPWALLLLLRYQEVKQGFWVPEATVLRITGQLAALMGGPAPAVATCLLAGLAFVDLDKPIDSIRRLVVVQWQSLLLLAWFGSSVFFALAVSKISVSIFVDRYLIGGLPALYLLSARGLVNLGGHRRAQQFVLGVVLVTFIFPLYRYAFVQEREDNRGAVEYVQKHRAEGEPLAYLVRWHQPVFRYYAPDDPRLFRQVIDLDEMPGKLRDAESYWLLLTAHKGIDRDAYLRPALESHEIRSEEAFARITIYHLVRRDVRVSDP